MSERPPSSHISCHSRQPEPYPDPCVRVLPILFHRITNIKTLCPCRQADTDVTSLCPQKPDQTSCNKFSTTSPASTTITKTKSINATTTDIYLQIRSADPAPPRR
ncbi:uncharacterized protein M6B38_377475 [Iris pallida]|uniref:Uncharacterized protein n=1 Tax=Iris pallida TaxID=29817 RepID=A0AAX6GAE1_IRIPA|nr:uncharacterized protein M6B38_377475 [Iris pallida]